MTKKLSLIFILLLSATGALACSCSENVSVEKQFAASTDVVLLKAVSPSKPLKSGADLTERVAAFNFTVQKVFKGSGLKVGQELPVFASGMCTFGFTAEDLGREYLFYWTSDYIGTAPPCDRSGPVEWRASDISYIENMNDVRGMTRISGVVLKSFGSAIESEPIRRVPLNEHVVRITGNGRDMRVRTDERGVYEVYGLPPGQYRVEPEKVKGYEAAYGYKNTSTASVTLASRQIVDVNFNFVIDNSIAGKALDAAGRPLARVRLHLVPAQGKRRWYFLESMYTEADGSFRFKNIPAGTYVIVGNPDDIMTTGDFYPRFYSSGLDDRSTATEITIGPGEAKEGFVVKVPAKR